MMPVGRAARNYRSGNSRSTRRSGQVYRGAPQAVPSDNKLQTGGIATSVKRRCPSCGLDVPVRADGELRNHRLGSSRRDSWPCPGEHAAPRPRRS